MRNTLTTVAIVIALITLIVVLRTIPHLPNFTPVAAVALFASVLLSNRLLGWGVAMLGMLISDAFFLPQYGFEMMAFNYIALSFPVLLAPLAAKYLSGITKLKTIKLFGLISIGSLAFFVLSNLGVWLYGGLYAPSFGGLLMCYIAALPFLLSTLLGDVFFSALLFGTYKKYNVQPMQLAWLKG